jgi:hypothetical protein
MLQMAIVTPAIGAVYLVWQIHKRDLRGWQHYACLTSLIFLISILFLVGSGKVESFGLAGNTVKVVDQKLAEIKALTEQNRHLAEASAEIAVLSTRRVARIGVEDSLEDWQNARDKIASSLQGTGLSENDISSRLKPIDNYIQFLKKEQNEKK